MKLNRLFVIFQDYVDEDDDDDEEDDKDKVGALWHTAGFLSGAAKNLLALHLFLFRMMNAH